MPLFQRNPVLSSEDMELKKEDKVHVYGIVATMADGKTMVCKGETAVVVGDQVSVGGFIQVVFKNGNIRDVYDVHVKQLRKVKPKLRIWVPLQDLKGKICQPCVAYAPKDGWVEFKET